MHRIYIEYKEEMLEMVAIDSLGEEIGEENIEFMVMMEALGAFRNPIEDAVTISIDFDPKEVDVVHAVVCVFKDGETSDWCIQGITKTRRAAKEIEQKVLMNEIPKAEKKWGGELDRVDIFSLPLED